MRGSWRIALGAFANKEGIKCAEIGVAFGDNAYYMLENMPNAEFYLIDSYDVNHPTFQHEKKVRTQEERKEFIDRVIAKLSPFGDRGKLIIKDSVEVSRDFPDGYFDYVYIDAEHDYESVKRDLETWYPKVKAGGIFAGHDFANGVRDAVVEKFPQFSNGEEGDWWIIKNE